MLRSASSRAVFGISLAVIWSAAMLGFAMMKETPVGTIRGRLEGVKTGRPIEGASVWLSWKTKENSNEQSRSTQTDANGRFSFDNVPVGPYTVEASAKVHSLPRIDVLVTEGDTVNLDLSLDPGPPDLKLYANQQTYISTEKPSLVLDGFTKGSSIKVISRRIDTGQLFSAQARPVRNFLAGSWSGSTNWRWPQNPLFKSYETRTINITKRDTEGTYHQTIDFGNQQPGIYLITAEVDNIERSAWFSVSDLSMVTKEGVDDLLIYTVRPDTGRPVQGAEVKVFSEDKIAAGGTTDSRGLWRNPLKVDSGARPHRLIVARYGDSTAFISTETYDRASGSVTIYAYTDRPVYRPGHTVYFKGIVRKFTGDAYKAPQQGEARVEVRDRRGSQVYVGTLPLNKFGSFHGDFKLPQYAATGYYDITCSFDGQQQMTNFNVAEYKKPEFTVSVETPKKRCIKGEKVKAKIRASYFFGAPVANAEVRYMISRSDYWFWPDEEEDYQYYDYGYEDYGGYGEDFQEGTVRTGDDGTAEIEFVADWKTSPDQYYQNDQHYTIYAYVTDQSSRQAEGQGGIIATNGAFRLGVDAKQYVAEPGKISLFTINTVDYDRKPQKGVTVKVIAESVHWSRDEEYKVQTAESTVKTDQTGRATFSFRPPKPGSYTIRASCRDAKGNEIKGAAWLWVSGGEARGYDYPDLQLILDKKSYNPGDTARLLINADKQGATALLTIEGRRLYDYKLVKLTSKSTVVEIPIEGAYRPNFYVSVCYVQDKKYYSQEARAKVSLNEQSLKLTVTPEKRKYEPGDQASYLIKSMDSKGKPVQAEVSLGIVDEAIYDIREDDTTPIRDFFYARVPNSIYTRYSFPEVYLSGDKAGFTGKVRKEFVDTAFWKADVVTDSNGQARVSLKLPDNLTSWRATARGCTMDTTVGQCRSNIVVSKKLLVRLQTPRFLVQRDEAVLTAMVHNYLPESQRVKVTLDAEGLSMSDPAIRTVTVTSQGVQPVQWHVKAGGVGQAKLTAYAVAAKAQDAMETSIPVRPHGFRLVQNKTGAVSEGAAEEKIAFQSDAVPGASRIRLRLAPSLAAAMLGSLDYLAEYPYGCTEQTMSTFLPDVVIWRTLKTLNISNPDLEKRIPDMVGKGLNRLYDFQNPDGGWGWCEYGSQDEWMTAYVVYGLLTAQSSGFSVNKEILNEGIVKLQQQASHWLPKNKDLSNRAFALYTLSLAGKNKEVNEGLVSLLNRKLDSNELALTAMTAANVGRTAAAADCMAQLWSKATVGGDQVHWKNDTDSYYYYVPETETTALALMAAVKLTPDDPRIPGVIRWLLERRSMNHWESTRDTAFVLYALSDYLKRSNELQPDFTATVLHNGDKIGQLKFDAQNFLQPERELVVRPKGRVSGEDTIRIETSGPGRLYYTIETVQYVDRKAPPRTASKPADIKVTREYFKLDPRRRGRGYKEPGNLTTRFRTGDTILVRLTVDSPREYTRLLIEDYLPAGCEAFDRGRLYYDEWSYWYVDKDVRDERVSFYIDTLPKGKQTLEYEIRPSVSGAYGALPTVVQAMYDPSVCVYGAEDTVEVGE